MGDLRAQTALTIRERAGGRKKKPHPEREDGHLRTMGVAACWVGVRAGSQSRLESLDPCASMLS
jgi:hypothetical protein